MALSGLEIFKLMPGSSKNPAVKAHANCKECGFPTCLAFSMKLAQKQAELAKRLPTQFNLLDARLQRS